MRRLVIIGSGGHAKVVADILRVSGDEVIGYLNDDPSTWGTLHLDRPVLGPVATLREHRADGAIIGIGSNAVRQRIATSLTDIPDEMLVNAIHPSAVLAPSASLGRGITIAAGAVVGADARIGQHVIINTLSSVDHDCTVGDFAHIAPGVHIAGNVRIGEGALLGIGAVAIPGVRIGEWATVGAGAAVIHDIPDRDTATGVPAQSRHGRSMAQG